VAYLATVIAVAEASIGGSRRLLLCSQVCCTLWLSQYRGCGAQWEVLRTRFATPPAKRSTLQISDDANFHPGSHIRILVNNRGYGAQWEVFADQIQPVARRMPWMTVGGNHERDWPDSGDRYGNVMDSGRAD